MPFRGDVVIECDQPDCQAEIIYANRLEDQSVHEALEEDGWCVIDGAYVCEDCHLEKFCPVCQYKPRTKDEYGRMYRRCDECEDGDTDPDIAVPFAANH
jgi:hypothetical protein